MQEEKLTLKDFAGQSCPVVITKREDGSRFVTFKFTPGYGYPSIELAKLKDLLKRIEDL